MTAHHAAGYELRIPLSIGVNVTNTKVPSSLPVGMTNSKPVVFVSREQAEKAVPPRHPKVALSFVVGKAEPPNEFTIGVQLVNISADPLPNVTVTLYADIGSQSPIALPFTAEAPGPLASQQPVHFALPFQHVPQLQHIVGSISPDRYALVIRSNNEDLATVPGSRVYGAVQYLQQLKAGKET